MVEHYRSRFNSIFSTAKYAEFLKVLEDGFAPLPIRLAETPVFIPEDFKNQLIAAGEEIIKLIKQPDFKSLTENAIPAAWNVPNENSHPHFLAIDFAVCKNEEGRLVPRLIEMQGFPSLFAFQAHLSNTYKQVFELDQIASLTPYFKEMTEEKYIMLLKKVIVGDYAPEEVALMDLDAPDQKTAIDFYLTQKHLGIPVLSTTDIFKEGNQLFYYDADGKKVRLKRIYNRLIFDELNQKHKLSDLGFDPREELDIEWITHPNWFYRISKFTMPLLNNEYVPETYYLNMVGVIPADLENYVLKPLYSFAGQGVIIDVKKADIEQLKDPQNWILQRKVIYEPVIQSPEGLVKVEIRLLYIWPDGEEPQLCINMARMSRGKMIGVQHNSDCDWVGGTVGLMEIDNF